MASVAELGAQTALYNQSNLLKDLNRDKSIQNDKNARGDVRAICDIDRNMRRRKKSRLNRIREDAEEMNRYYRNLRKNPKVSMKYKKRIGRQQSLWNVVIGIAKIAGVVALIVGVGAVIYVVTENPALAFKGAEETAKCIV
eukprot:UN09770